MAVKKSQLYSTLWESCNALRGSMDASQYKDYVLMILFVKYLSDKAHQKQTPLQIPEGCYFEDFVALKQNDHIGELINEKLEAIREANAIYIGDLTLPNFNDPAKLGETKTRTETLSKLIAEFQRNELNFGLNRAADDDLLGDAYEYLMKNFAAESGKSKGQFYTPAEVSRVMAKVLHLENLHRAGETIYDPTCGSGSLLLRALNETSTGKCAIRGQELDSTTAALAKLNMLLHGIVTAQIKVGDTLNAPKFTTGGMLETFDICVANPPFSKKNWLDSGGESDEYHRWSSTLLPPYKFGDFAFLLHLIASMKEDTGRGACILPHGVLFRGNSEYDIRKDIIQKKYIKGIIGLPSNLFFGTGIPACIFILDKAERSTRKGIFMINAKYGYMKDGAKNRLREQDIKLIVDTWNNGVDVPHYARFVEWSEIEKNDFNLNLSRYITPPDIEVIQDIHAHLNLKGGLPEHDINQMASYWAACPSLKGNLFSDYTPGYFKLNGDIRAIPQRIAQDASFKVHTAQYKELITQWLASIKPSMLSISKNCTPKAIIGPWGESLLETIPNNSLVNRYDVYNYLMNYWLETVQDDCYMVSNDGWIAQPYTPQPKEKKKKDGTIVKPKEKVATSVYDIVCDLLPVDIVVNEFFFKDIGALDELASKIEEIQGSIDLLLEEKSDYFDDFEKVSDSKVNAALTEVKNGKRKADSETLSVWSEYSSMCKNKKALSKQLSLGHMTLLKAVLKKYQDGLSEDVVRNLVINNKWQQTLKKLFEDAMRIVSNDISESVCKLAKRYEFTLNDIETELHYYKDKVSSHLYKMGYESLPQKESNSSASSSNLVNKVFNGETRLKGFSAEWKSVKISDIAEEITDGPFGSNLKTEHYTDRREARIIQLSNVGESGWNDDNVKYTTFSHAKELKRCIVPGGSIVVAKMMPAGRAIICPDVEEMYIQGSDVVKIVLKEGYNPKFFVYMTKSKAYLDQIEQNIQGSTRARVSVTKLKTITIPMPSLAEQNTIVEYIEDVEKEEEAMSKAINKYQCIREGMMQQLLIG